MASHEALSRDLMENGATRARRLELVGQRRATSLRVRVDELAKALRRDGSVGLPHWKSAEYRQLDRLQQIFVKEPEHPLVGMVASECPELLSHLIAWKGSKHRKTQDKSDEAFRARAKRVHDFVMREQRPPSVADEDEQTQDDARWLWRWKLAANGRSNRRRNLERAELFFKVGLVIEMLMSSSASVRADGLKSLSSGRWTSLFDGLMATSYDYQYQR